LISLAKKDAPDDQKLRKTWLVLKELQASGKLEIVSYQGIKDKKGNTS
jgi:hypothetical protein